MGKENAKESTRKVYSSLSNTGVSKYAFVPTTKTFPTKTWNVTQLPFSKNSFYFQHTDPGSVYKEGDEKSTPLSTFNFTLHIVKERVESYSLTYSGNRAVEIPELSGEPTFTEFNEILRKYFGNRTAVNTNNIHYQNIYDDAIKYSLEHIINKKTLEDLTDAFATTTSVRGGRKTQKRSLRKAPKRSRKQRRKSHKKQRPSKITK